MWKKRTHSRKAAERRQNQAHRMYLKRDKISKDVFEGECYLIGMGESATGRALSFPGSFGTEAMVELIMEANPISETYLLVPPKRHSLAGRCVILWSIEFPADQRQYTLVVIPKHPKWITWNEVFKLVGVREENVDEYYAETLTLSAIQSLHRQVRSAGEVTKEAVAS